MQSYIRSGAIFVGATVSAGMLAFVSMTPPYHGIQVFFLVIGSVTAGIASMFVELGIGDLTQKRRSIGPEPVAPGAPAGAGQIAYALLQTSVPGQRPPLIGRERDLAEISRLLTTQQEVGG